MIHLDDVVDKYYQEFKGSLNVDNSKIFNVTSEWKCLEHKMISVYYSTEYSEFSKDDISLVSFTLILPDEYYITVTVNGDKLSILYSNYDTSLDDSGDDIYIRNIPMNEEEFFFKSLSVNYHFSINSINIFKEINKMLRDIIPMISPQSR